MRLRFYAVIVGLTAVLIAPHVRASEIRESCIEAQLDRGMLWSGCTYISPDASQDGLVLLHGLGGSHRDLAEATRMIKGFQRRGLRPPRIMTFSMGPAWLARRELAGWVPDSHIRKLFTDIALPRLRLSAGVKGRLFGRGISMGGINLAALTHFYPEAFSRVNLHCPGLFTMSLFATPVQVVQYARDNHANLFLVNAVLPLLGAAVGHPKAWKDMDPHRLAQMGQGAREFPPVMITANKDDDFGLYKPAHIYARELIEGGVLENKISFRSLEGHHCVNFPYEDLALFFSDGQL